MLSWTRSGQRGFNEWVIGLLIKGAIEHSIDCLCVLWGAFSSCCCLSAFCDGPLLSWSLLLLLLLWFSCYFCYFLMRPNNWNVHGLFLSVCVTHSLVCFNWKWTNQKDIQKQQQQQQSVGKALIGMRSADVKAARMMELVLARDLGSVNVPLRWGRLFQEELCLQSLCDHCSAAYAKWLKCNSAINNIKA